ncbi:MAG TPA: asparagine synthase (glutamine-hydrolyzing) [Hydrogenophaga sp.]|uniref:asparagine synthase (glutamine-hydrolyzing) n=1 Tax=Hydrogenophaga sp. TaxID=1904254 RepID=UPI002C7A67B8|nr:asparagine synthase (glutamine-hydrolyzing) [Hydrogenophaga sp.]HMN92008.1 asparagine synthase (glutamine-hydrolyzing) [Hydrogenophaga sp.]HMP08810.1 asparagine synthase (glutamine-hydrolyzing) [Hydrogenophaga sp.]
MCGIAGIIGASSDANRAALRRMTDAMRLRGPDAEGFWESPADQDGNTVMFGHRRLSILDLSDHGAQPMLHPASGDVIVLNGEIYNFQTLGAELGDEPGVLQSSGDTAVLLRALSAQSDHALPRLRGMYAFAFWHKATGHLLIARDPMGIKPLYFAMNVSGSDDWTCAFASEVRALLAAKLIRNARLNPKAVGSVVWNGYTVAPETAVLGIESLLPGEAMWLNQQGRVIRRFNYWHHPQGHKGNIATQEEVESALIESVRAHMISDVPLGIFLSGGVDSSAVANLAKRAGAAEINSFTLTFEEADRNEAFFARQVADAIGTRHQEILLTEQSFLDHLESALDSLDQPSFDGLNTYFMSRAVRDAGFKVALVGTGGDELFGGYQSFSDLPKLHNGLRFLRALPGATSGLAASMARALFSHTSDGFPPQTRWAKLPTMIEQGESLISLYQIAYSLFLPDAQRSLIHKDIRSDMLEDGLPSSRRDSLGAELNGRSTLDAISVLEHRMFLGERLLRDTDATSMAASLETRLPFVDTKLLSVISRMETDARFHPLKTKLALRRAGLKGLDLKMFDRPKSGFELPFNRWLKSSLGEEIGSSLLDSTWVASAGLQPQAVARLWQSFTAGAKGLYWSRIWALYSLIRWVRVNRVTL